MFFGYMLHMFTFSLHKSIGKITAKKAGKRNSTGRSAVLPFWQVFAIHNRTCYFEVQMYIKHRPVSTLAGFLL